MCNGTTKSGNPCKASGVPYCRHHKPPQEKDHLPLSHPKALKKYRAGPSKTDGPGHIYVYFVDIDKIDTYYKIGRTSKGVAVRLGQWKKSILKKAYYVKNQKLAESLIHLELDKVRVYRYRLEDGSYYTVWKKTGLPVERELPEGVKLSAAKKNIEWFKTEWKFIKDVIGTIVNLVNDTPSSSKLVPFIQPQDELKN